MRRFALGTAAPLVAGGAITYDLWVMRDFNVMAPAWLLLYSVGVLTGGMFSVPVVRALGACFMAAGIAASLTLPEWGNVWLGIGFGGADDMSLSFTELKSALSATDGNLGGHVRKLEDAGYVSCDKRLKAAHRGLITG